MSVSRTPPRTSSVARPDDGGGGAGGGSATGGDPAARRIIISAPVCFVIAKKGCLPSKDLRAVLTGFYTSEQLTEGSRLLLAEIVNVKPDFSGKLVNRRNSNNFPEAKLRSDADDLISLVTGADEASLLSNLPIFATVDPDLIPSRQLLEGGLMAIMRQFSTMSEQFADIKSSIEHMSVNNSYAAVFPPLE